MACFEANLPKDIVDESSSSRAASTDFPDSLSSSIPILHRPR